jgi:hypothetical protein
MDEAERSRLLYLLDAVRAAPQKSAKLIAVVARESASESFKQAIEKLRTTDNVVEMSQALRSHLL